MDAASIPKSTTKDRAANGRFLPGPHPHRLTKLTPELQERICDLIRGGNYIETACRACGISTFTYYMWLQRAEAGEQPYAGFAEATKRAHADAETMLLETIKLASIKSWQAAAWILERTRPDTYSQRLKVDYGQLRRMAEQVAAETGQSVEELMAEAERIAVGASRA